jgi:ABC-type nitrate/sulfonate/bicarbonate transport system substrate-binding protein
MTIRHAGCAALVAQLDACHSACCAARAAAAAATAAAAVVALLEAQHQMQAYCAGRL